ncbi:MAG: TonB-dependent receptor [Bacteroidetes bacterium]|nr:TonB-dependent receptor [Bacteroidota bacterium]
MSLLRMFCVFTFAGLISVLNADAQTSDTIRLKEVEIHSDRNNLFDQGSHITNFDSSTISLAPNQTIAELLQQNSAMFIKSYGAGGVAVISARGTEARHNNVLWHGFNINSASLGLSDLSIIPSFITDNIQLIHGGSSPVNGNAALGSTLILNNHKPEFKKAFKSMLNFETGSFGNYQGNASVDFSNDHVTSATKVFYHTSENDFTYINTTHRLKPEVKQTHGAVSGYGFLQDFCFKTGSNQYISAGIWYQFTNREIPPLMTVPESHAEQRDSVLRTYLNYRILINKHSFKVSAGWFQEYQFYVDSKSARDLDYLVINYNGEFEWRYFYNDKIIINSGVSSSLAQASFKEYDQQRQRNTTSLFSGISFRPFSGWDFHASVRSEFTNVQNPPVAPAIGFNGNLLRNKLYLVANSGISYSIPSMNDLYWIPGGNAHLKTETAFSHEAGISLFPGDSVLPQFRITGFISNVDNWIRWQPTTGGIHSPDNLQQVQIKGVEAQVSWTKSAAKLMLTLNANYSWNISAIVASENPHSAAIIDKQIPYIPEHRIAGSIYLHWHQFMLAYQQNFTGITYTTADNNSHLNDYATANVTLSKNINIQKTGIRLYFRVTNLFDAQYQVMAYRPMPGRWISTGVTLKLNHH